MEECIEGHRQIKNGTEGEGADDVTVARDKKMVPRTRRKRRCEPPRCIQFLVVVSMSLTVMAYCASGALLLFGLDSSLLLVYRNIADYILASVHFFVVVLVITNCAVAYCGLHFESKTLLLIVIILGLFTMILQFATSLTTITLADLNFLSAGINSTLLEVCNNSKIYHVQRELNCCVYCCPITNCTSVEKFNDCASVLSNKQKYVLYSSFGVDVVAIVLEIITTYLLCCGICQIRKYEHYDVI